MEGKVPSSLFSVCVSLWIIQYSNRHRLDVLWLVSNICVCVQSIVWPVLHACSTRVDVVTFLSLTACWCSFNLCHRVLPVWPMYVCVVSHVSSACVPIHIGRCLQVSCSHNTCIHLLYVLIKYFISFCMCR